MHCAKAWLLLYTTYCKNILLAKFVPVGKPPHELCRLHPILVPGTLPLQSSKGIWGLVAFAHPHRNQGELESLTCPILPSGQRRNWAEVSLALREGPRLFGWMGHAGSVCCLHGWAKANEPCVPPCSFGHGKRTELAKGPRQLT